MEYEVKDRNEWFEEVERAYSKLNCVSADVTADAYIEDIKYCPFCGEEL